MLSSSNKNNKMISSLMIFAFLALISIVNVKAESQQLRLLFGTADDCMNKATVPITIDGKVRDFSLCLTQHPTLMAAEFCMKESVKNMDTCISVERALANLALTLTMINPGVLDSFSDPKFTPALTFNDKLSRSIVSNRRRMYLDTVRSAATLDQFHGCVFLDGLVNAGCMSLPAPDKIFFEGGSIQPGSHMILLGANDTSSNLIVQDAVFFYSVESNIEIVEPVDQQVIAGPQIPITVFLDDFDPSWDAEICIVIDGAKNCIDKAVVAQLYNNLPKDENKKGQSISLMLSNLRKGVHAISTMVLDAQREVIALSKEIKIELQQGSLDNMQPITAEKFFFTIQGERAPELVDTLTKGNCAGWPENTAYHWLCFLPYHEWAYTSRRGQDGILHSILSNLGSHPSNGGVYVDLGNSGPAESNSKFLRERYGYRGVQMDPLVHDPQNAIVKESVNPNNLNQLLKKYSVPKDFDVLSVNMGTNDFWLWSEMDREQYTPKVVVIGYNGYLAPNDMRVAKYNEKHMMDGTTYFGASLGALRALGDAKGYSLGYCESKGTTCFFIRNDLLGGVLGAQIKPEVVYRETETPAVVVETNEWLTIKQ